MVYFNSTSFCVRKYHRDYGGFRIVTFLDPLRKNKDGTQLELSYHIDKSLTEKWDKIQVIDGKSGLIKKDSDRCYIVDGRERTGKSVFALQQAKYINPLFSLDDICYTPEQFLDRIRNSPKGSVIVFDEAFRGLSSKGSQSKVNKKIVQAMMEMGQRNLVVFIVLPTFFLLEMYAAVLRSHALFHVFKDKNGKRRVKLYNYQKKSLLYNIGKKKGFSYSFPKIRITMRFFNKYSVDETAYRKKKFDSLTESDKETYDQEEKKDSIRKKICAVNLYLKLKKYENITQPKFCELLYPFGWEMDRSTLSKWKAEVEKWGFVVNSGEKKDNSKGLLADEGGHSP